MQLTLSWLRSRSVPVKKLRVQKEVQRQLLGLAIRQFRFQNCPQKVDSPREEGAGHADIGVKWVV